MDIQAIRDRYETAKAAAQGRHVGGGKQVPEFALPWWLADVGALLAALSERALVPTESRATGAGDADVVCLGCQNVTEAHTWEVCVETLRAERDAAIDRAYEEDRGRQTAEQSHKQVHCWYLAERAASDVAAAALAAAEAALDAERQKRSAADRTIAAAWTAAYGAGFSGYPAGATLAGVIEQLGARLAASPASVASGEATTPWLRDRGIVWRGSITDLETDVRHAVAEAVRTLSNALAPFASARTKADFQKTFPWDFVNNGHFYAAHDAFHGADTPVGKLEVDRDLPTVAEAAELLTHAPEGDALLHMLEYLRRIVRSGTPRGGCGFTAVSEPAGEWAHVRVYRSGSRESKGVLIFTQEESAHFLAALGVGELHAAQSALRTSDLYVHAYTIRGLLFKGDGSASSSAAAEALYNEVYARACKAAWDGFVEQLEDLDVEVVNAAGERLPYARLGDVGTLRLGAPRRVG